MPGTAHPTPPTPGNPAGSGYEPCFLTWYDPALGGTNSSGGVKDPHAAMANGKPYDPNAYICAAPQEFVFGTKVEIHYHGKVVICEVTDRGSAITGGLSHPHFDLGRKPATDLGIISPGQTADTGSGEGTYKITSAPAGPNTPGVGQQALDSIGSAFSSVGDAIGGIGKALSFIFSLQFLYILGGGAILLIGLVLVARSIK